MAVFSQEEHLRISAAIEAAETKTSGEIFAAISRESDDYLFIALFWASLLALIFGALFAVACWVMSVNLPALALVFGQTAALLSIAVILYLRDDVRMFLVPDVLKRRRCHRHAREQFLAHNLHATAERTGVLIFVSLGEHHAEVLADGGIYERVSPDVWDRVVDVLTSHASEDRLADGFVRAIEDVGAILAEHFPPNAEDENELPDRLVEL